MTCSCSYGAIVSSVTTDEHYLFPYYYCYYNLYYFY